MIKVQSVNLYDILPQILKKDETITAICKILQKYIDENFKLIKNIVLLPNIDNLEEDILDHLAYQFHVDFYDPSLSIRHKRKLIKESIPLHKTKGTPHAIESALKAVDLKGNVEEWFEYNYLPYHFLIELDVINDFGDIDDIRRMTMCYKNTRSWFDGFVILINAGRFTIKDDSYSYLVFYKDCGWFTGIKYYTEFNFNTIELLDKTYDYEVPYPVSEKEVAYTDIKPMMIRDDSYSYIKEFPYANEMELLLKEVETQTSKLDCKNENYEYPVSYVANTKELITVDGEITKVTESSYSYHKEFPVASEMEPMIKITATHEDAFSCKEKSYNFEQTYPICGEFYAGS